MPTKPHADHGDIVVDTLLRGLDGYKRQWRSGHISRADYLRLATALMADAAVHLAAC